MVSMILKILNVKHALDKSACQKDIVQHRRLKKLNFVGLMIRFSYFLNQLINANVSVNIKV